MKEKPVVGQILFSLNVGNAARGVQKQLTPVVVKSVGRKYFSCVDKDSPYPNPMETEYHLDTWKEKTNYCESSLLYTTKKEWVDERDMDDGCNFIETAFHYGRNVRGLSLETISAITKLIREGATK